MATGALGRFNSRTPGGVRRIAPQVVAVTGERFNSRTPGGVRQRSSNLFRGLTRFNSRTPGGVRHSRRGACHRCVCVSIHAPREGCDGRYVHP